MSDSYLINFYNDIKDGSWSDIESYDQFLELPEHITDECYIEHNFKQRLQNIENPSYWDNWIYDDLTEPVLENNRIGFRYKNIVYVPVPKCASSYYRKFFGEYLKWVKVKLHELDWNKIHAFGLILHPLTKRLKGLVESLTTACDKDDNIVHELINTEAFINFTKHTVMGDSHTLPYSIEYEHLYDIDWIPIENMDPERIKLLVDKFMMHYNVPVRTIKNDELIYKSNTIKRKAYDKMRDAFLSHTSNETIYRLYADDLKFYHTLVKNFNAYGENWREISWLR